MKKWISILVLLVVWGMSLPTAGAEDYDDGTLYSLFNVRSDTSITGIVFDEGWDTIHIQIGSKHYKGKIRWDGDFTVKIPKQMEGTVLKVHFTSSSGDESNVRKITLKYESNYFDLSGKDVFISSKQVKGKYTGYMKGDKLTATIGKKTYKAKFTKTGSFTISIPKQKAGVKIKLNLYNSKGKKIESTSLKVYTSDSISIGMTKKQVLATSWGSPSKKYTTISKYGNYEQWVYNWNDDTSDYLFFDNGKLTSIDSY